MKSSLRVYTLVEIATVIYLLLTGIFIIVFYNSIELAWFHLMVRIIFSALIYLFARLRKKQNTQPVVNFFLFAYPLAFLAYLYPETDALNNVFYQNLDFKFVFFEYSLFGYQPSIEFHKNFPAKWLIELMSFGYFFYYLLIIGVLLWIYVQHRPDFQRAIFIVCSSFYVYYALFIIFPVVGPQFYFSNADSQIGNAGPFRWAMQWIEFLGERPTGAFPSSHVGISLIILILIYQKQKFFFITLLPFSILLVLSTVYMKAHYFVDVVAGIITGIMFFSIFSYTYHLISGNKPTS